MTPAEQAIVDLVEHEGPMTRDVLLAGGTDYDPDRVACPECDELLWQGHDAECSGGGLASGIDSLSSRGLLLERERTMECSICGGRGTVTGTGGEGRICPTCSVEGDKWGTGSVKERVIGVRCRECRGAVYEVSVVAPGRQPEPCPRCSSTPTPGLDPGSESDEA